MPSETIAYENSRGLDSSFGAFSKSGLDEETAHDTFASQLRQPYQNVASHPRPKAGKRLPLFGKFLYRLTIKASYDLPAWAKSKVGAVKESRQTTPRQKRPTESRVRLN